MALLSGARPAPVNLLRFRLPLLDAYILREFALPFTFAFLAFFLFWGFNIFFLAAKYLLTQNAPFILVLRFVVFRIPQSIPMTFAFATLFATLLGMGRLMADNEISALRTSGVSLWRLCLTPIVFGFCAFVIAWVTNESIAPRAVDLSTRTFYQIIYRTQSLPVEPQFFRRDPDTGNVFYVTQVLPDGKTMTGVQIFKPARGGGVWNQTLQAKSAHIDNGSLVLNDVVITYYNGQGFESSQTHTPELRVGLPLGETAADFMSSTNTDAYTMNTKQLSAQVHALKSQGVGGEALGNLEMNLANKSAFPFASFVAVLIALPTAIRFGRRGRMTGMALSLVAFFIYYILTEAAAALGTSGRVDPYLASWLPNIIFGGAGVALLWSEEH